MNPIDLVAGARPNFVKLAPVVHAFLKRGDVPFRIVHTGQHYDPTMNDVFFEQLRIPRPEVHLDVGSGTHGVQTARILERYEEHLLQREAAMTVVFGDVNSTVACALAAAKLGVPVCHVEAGLRSFDRTMPEELNRILTDALADLLLVSEPSGLANLAREGVDAARVRHVGNVMIDTLTEELPAARSLAAWSGLGLTEGGYGLVTLHRPSNVDDPAVLRGLFRVLREMSERLPLVLPLHPRTAKALAAAEIEPSARGDRMRIVEPLPYRANLSLMSAARVVVTDSGGMQEETTVLGVPCITLRPNTERPITIDLGTSRLVGNDPEAIRTAFEDVLAGNWPAGSPVPLWDGRTGARIVDEIAAWLSAHPTRQ